MKFQIPESWPTPHPHVFQEGAKKSIGVAEWEALGRPHVWSPGIEKDGLVIFNDSGYGWTALVQKLPDGTLLVCDCATNGDSVLRADFSLGDGTTAHYVYLDLEYYGADVGGIYKRCE